MKLHPQGIYLVNGTLQGNATVTLEAAEDGSPRLKLPS